MTSAAPTDSATSSAPPRILTSSTEDLLAQVAWFNRLRLVVVAGMIALTAVGAHLLHAVADSAPLYVRGGYRACCGVGHEFIPSMAS